MDSDASGWLWLMIDVAMVALLAIALIYGTMLWRQRRSRALQQASERATAQLYEPIREVSIHDEELATRRCSMMRIMAR
jgi:flagellar basal body-associated protein FliL